MEQQGIVSDADAEEEPGSEEEESAEEDARRRSDAQERTERDENEGDEAANNGDKNSSGNNPENQQRQRQDPDSVSPAGPSNEIQDAVAAQRIAIPPHQPPMMEGQGQFSYPPHPNPLGWSAPPNPSGQPPQQHPSLLHFYEAQMRDHAVAYASAAAGAAWAAAQIAADISNAAATGSPAGHLPPRMPMFPPMAMMQPSPHMYTQAQHPPSPHYGDPNMMFPPDAGSPHAPHYNNMYDYHDNSAVASYGTEQDSISGPQQRRRKRQQRMPPVSHPQHHQQGFAPIQPHHSRNMMQHPQQPSNYNNSNEKRGRRRRRFRNNDGGSSDEYRRPRVRKMTFSSNSDGGGSASSSSKVLKKKQRQPNDESLLGKTGVSALYEWCGKRRTTPSFWPVALQHPHNPQQQQQDFEMSVCVDGMECGKGRGRTKSAAKQEAARRALQVLLPGVVFDAASGILIELPQQQQQQHTTKHAMSNYYNQQQQPKRAINATNSSAVSSSLEDLAPNLAKRLAIGKTNDDEENENDDDDGGQRKKGATLNKTTRSTRQKLSAVYPGTSTTSDDEDENAYYASRGASICSALLHAMVQIDDRIPEAPTYTYQVLTVPPASINANNSPSATTSSSQLKRKAGGPGSSPTLGSSSPPIVIHRGSFTCVAKMRLLTENPENPSAKTYEILQTNGAGCTKREARHTASARLLALLFPECDGLVQVKEAAEAARERYAASKALKQQSKREKRSFVLGRPHSNSSHYAAGGGGEDNDDDDDDDGPANLAFAMATHKDSAGVLSLPAEVEARITKALGPTQVVSEDDSRGESRKTAVTEESSSLARQESRQKQLDQRIASALQKLNEHDEEGRSLPDELTADDVGRTVLRRASPEDLDWIVKLFDTGASFASKMSSTSPISILGDTTAVITKAASSSPSSKVDRLQNGNHAFRLWSSSTIVLLLCRAIAPYEDPPLGCAALTLGFSMAKGRELRIAQLASKPHLPRERFIECLQSFARCMGCALEATSTTTSAALASSKHSIPVKRLLRQDECQKIVSSHLGLLEEELLFSANNDDDSPNAVAVASFSAALCEQPFVSLSLQAVQEESEDNDVDDAGGDNSTNVIAAQEEETVKKGKKPSKRSRVQ